MAYPTVSAPYGLKPVNLIGGQPYAGSTRLFKIASGYGTDIFYGDVVATTTDGTLVKVTGTTTAQMVGIFLGWENLSTIAIGSGSVPTFTPAMQYWPANTVSANAYAVVADDPDILFKVAVVSGTTVIAGVGRTVIGNNFALVQNAGSTTTGNSAVAVLSTSAATTISLPIRCIDVVPDTATGTDTFVELICKWNVPYFTLSEGAPNTITWAGGHQYLNSLGV